MEYLLLLLALVYACYTDSRTMEIPIPVFPSVIAFTAILRIYRALLKPSDFVFAMLLFIAMLLVAMFLDLGGGDVLMITAIAFVMRGAMLFFAVSLFVVGNVYLIVNREKRGQTVCLAPLFLAAYVVAVVIIQLFYFL